MQKKIIVVREADMEKTALFGQLQSASPQVIGKALKSIATIVAERADYEAQRERMFEGKLQVVASPDVKKHLEPLATSEAFARMVVALKINPRSYIFPQSQEGGKSETETSNLKAYRKVRQISEVIFNGVSDLENVAKVFSVCAFRFASNGHSTLTREYCANFLTSREFTSLDTGTADLWNAIDDIRAKQMTDGGASTQSGQMVRSLVALKSARDVRDGRAKNVEIFNDGLVMQALMMRLGQLSE